MERIAKFHKVSYEQFEGDWKDTFGPIETEEIKSCLLYTSPSPRD